MRALDTNVLVRYLTQDDPIQSAAAASYIQEYCTREHPGYINRIVMCELVWVLEGAYGYEKTQIADVLEKILQTGELIVEDSDAVWQSLDGYRKGKADFADLLLGRLNKSSGCHITATFDKKAGKLEYFELITD